MELLLIAMTLIKVHSDTEITYISIYDKLFEVFL